MIRDWADIETSSESSRADDSEDETTSPTQPAASSQVTTPASVQPPSPSQNAEKPKQPEEKPQEKSEHSQSTTTVTRQTGQQQQESREPRNKYPSRSNTGINNNNDRPQKKFMTSEEIIKGLEERPADSDFTLNVIYCFHYDEDFLREKFPMAKSINHYKEGSYEIKFTTREKAIEFVKEKDANGYKFRIKLNPLRQPHARNEQRHDNRRRENAQHPRRQPEAQKKTTVTQPSAVQEASSAKAQDYTQENGFDENKISFRESMNAQGISDYIKKKDLFTEFATYRLLVNDPKLLSKAIECAAGVVDIIKGCYSTKEGTEKAYTIKIIEGSAPKQLKPEVQLIAPKTQKVQQPASEQSKQPAQTGTPKAGEYAFKHVKKEQQNQNKVEEVQPEREIKKQSEQAYGKTRKWRIFRNRNKMLFRNDEEAERAVEQIRGKDLLNGYGNIRIEVLREDEQRAGKFIEYIQKQCGCYEQYRRTTATRIVYVLQELSKKKEPAVGKGHSQQGAGSTFSMDGNRIKIEKNTNKKKLVEELRKIQNKLQKEFDILRLIAPQDCASLAEEIKDEIVKSCRYDYKDRETKGDSIHILLVERKRIMKKNFNFLKTNKIDIDEDTDLQELVAQAGKSKKDIFNSYKCLKLECTADQLQRTKEIVGKLEKQINGVMAEETKFKDRDTEQVKHRFEFVDRKTFEETTKKANEENAKKMNERRKKVDPSEVHKYLSS